MAECSNRPLKTWMTTCLNITEKTHDAVEDGISNKTAKDEDVQGPSVDPVDDEEVDTVSKTSERRPKSVQKNGVIVTDGWLLLRSRFSKKWKKRWFVLHGVNLRYGASETKLKAKISLDGARIREADKDAKRCAFCIEPRSGHRIFYFQAADDVSRMKWMQAMCFAKFSSHRSDDDDDDIFKRPPCTIS